MAEVKVTNLIEKMNLTILNPEVDLEKRKITVPDILRPSLQLAGYLQHFDRTRVEIIGFVEASYMETMEKETKEKLRNCKTEEEAMDVLKGDMIPIPDDVLDEVAGGDDYVCMDKCMKCSNHNEIFP